MKPTDQELKKVDHELQQLFRAAGKEVIVVTADDLAKMLPAAHPVERASPSPPVH